MGARRVAVAAAALAVTLAADALPRSRAVVRAFQLEYPCPSTGAPRGPCPGFEADHIVPLCAGGPDAVGNLQWLTHAEHRVKTKRDVAGCRGRVHVEPPDP